MSQPQRSESQEPDPLLAFLEEQERTEVPSVPEVPDLPEVPAATAAADPPADVVRRLERQVERTLIEITSLKSDLATLVSAVDDIKKRMSPASEGFRGASPVAVEGEGGRARPRARAVALSPRRRPSPRAIAAIVMLLIAGAAVWGLVAAATYALAEPVPIESESLRIIELPPTVRADPPDRPGPPGGTERPRVFAYVGTLTVDADPAGDVYLNRKPVGRTPLRLANLRAGSHLIWIEREGYRRFTRVVPVAADRISRITASLAPLSR